MEISLNVNGATRTVDVDADTPLLWVIRESLGLTGTKFGCGIAACGACILMAPRRVPARFQLQRCRTSRSPPSKGWRLPNNSMQCKLRGLLNKCLSAAIASRE